MSLEEIEVPSSSPPITKVSIVGIGSAGNHLVDQGIERGIDPGDCVAVNNDTGQLSQCIATNKVFIGANATEQPEFEKIDITKFYQSSVHRVNSFTQASNFTIVVAGLGGSTGTATAPLVAQYNRTMVKPVISIVAIPFIHERERRFVALRGLKKMVDACDSTIIIDNSMDTEKTNSKGRTSDVIASVALHTLSRIMRLQDQKLSQKFLKTLSLGNITMFAMAPWTHQDTIQSVVYNALGSPSAKMPLTNATGAVLVYSGPGQVTMAQSARAYETIVSLVGHDVKFLYANLTDDQPRISIFLSGYTYESTLGAFVEFIQDLYDLEYGEEKESNIGIGIELSISNME